MKAMEELQKSICNRVVQRMDLTSDISDEEIREWIDEVIFEEEESRRLSVWQKVELQKAVFHSLRGLDVLQELIESRGITEIMINGAEDIFIEENGRIRRWDKQFTSKEKLEDVVQQIVSKANRVVNE